MQPHHKARRGLRALVLTLTLTLGGVAMTTAPASAAAKQPTVAELGATWMAQQITANGGYLKSSGAPDAPDTAYAVIGLHAAKVGGSASAAAITWLETQLGAPLQLGGTDAPGALSYYIMAAVTAGADPHHFGGTAPPNDLVARLLATQRTTGSNAGLFGAQDPSFDGAFRQGLALAALKAVKTKSKDPHVVAAIAWTAKQQCANGLFQSYRADTTVACPPADPTFFTGPDTNSSSLALQGLAAWAKKPNRKLAIAALHAVQSADGGFSFMAAPGQASDPNSTALVIQALLAIGSSPKTKSWVLPGGTPYTALASYQLGCSPKASDRGAFTFPGIPGANVFATVQSVPAAASKKLPVAKVAKLKAPIAPCTTTTGACVGTAGVTLAVDLTSFGQGVHITCTMSSPHTGIEALQQAGFTVEGTQNFGLAFVCRINGKPAVAADSCVSTPPPTAYWAYYHANQGQSAWTKSAVGASTYDPPDGSIEAWAFGASAAPSLTPVQVRGT